MSTETTAPFYMIVNDAGLFGARGLDADVRAHGSSVGHRRTFTWGPQSEGAIYAARNRPSVLEAFQEGDPTAKWLPISEETKAALLAAR